MAWPSPTKGENKTTTQATNLQSIALLCLVLICPTEHGALLKSGKELVMQQNSLTFDQWWYVLKKTYRMYPAVFKVICCILPCFTDGCQNFAPHFYLLTLRVLIQGHQMFWLWELHEGMSTCLLKM